MLLQCFSQSAPEAMPLHMTTNLKFPCQDALARTSIALASALALCFQTSCSQVIKAPAADAPVTNEADCDVEQVILDFPPFAELRADHELNDLFKDYMDWVASLGVPDAVLVVGLMESQDRTMDSYATEFHELVEFKGWLDLNHDIQDFMTIEYYQANYQDVYPVAHRKGTVEEFSLIRHFAAALGFREIPELAYALVSPLVERHNTDSARLARRLKFNSEFLTTPVSDEDLELAVQVYEAGGYRYKDRDNIIAESREYLGTLPTQN